MPESFTLEQWEAFQLLSAGSTQIFVALQVGRSRGTVQTWVKKWRGVWGPDVVTTLPSRQPPPIEARQRGGKKRGEMVKLEHRERRAAMANEQSTMASLLVEVGMAIAGNLVADPELIKGYGPKEMLELVRAIDVLSKRADLLSDISPADRAFVAQQNNLDLSVDVGVDLSSLDAASDSSEVQETLRAVEAIVNRFDRGGGEVIEVEEA